MNASLKENIAMDHFATDLKLVSDSYSWFPIRIRSFEVEYETGKFKSDSLVF